MRRGRRAILVALCVCVTGCRGSDRITSSGTIRFDGRPVESGVVVFRPFDRDAAPEGGAISGGRFTVTGRPGRRRVEIRGTRVVAPDELPRTMPRFVDAPVHEDYIPAAYNTASTLEVEVKAGGPNVFDFDLASPPRP